MKKLTISLLAFVLTAACNNNKSAIENKKSGPNDSVAATRGDSASQYKWTDVEKKKFLGDCKQESSEDVQKDKLDEFCNCLLTESQKYYPSYKQMNDKSNEDHDEEIFKKCVGVYGGTGEQ
jgi:hypothetical protein